MYLIKDEETDGMKNFYNKLKTDLGIGKVSE